LKTDPFNGTQVSAHRYSYENKYFAGASLGVWWFRSRSD
jgi:hypothetical protein